MRTHPSAFPQPRAARLSPLAASLALALAPAAHALTYTVSNNGDSAVPGSGTLRAAIDAANLACSTDPFPFIQFDGAFTISPATPLPAFSCASGAYNPTIDGSYGGAAAVVINGSAASASCGLDYQYDITYGGRLTVQYMTVQNFTYGSFSAGVCGTVDVKASTLRDNSVGAYLRSGGSSFIGDSESPNVITGNSKAGIWSYGASSQISSNLIGTANGRSADPNGTGVYAGAGGSTSISDNVISGNSGLGVDIRGDSGSSLSGNFIGTDTSGTALANGGGGVLIRCSNSLWIYNNTVSHNQFEGLSLDAVSDSYVLNNNINANSGTGIRVYDSGLTGAGCNPPSSNYFDGNQIRDNGQNGILLLDGYVNLIYGGSITGNKIKNININGVSGPLPNDPGDIDDGPNGQMNYPEIISVVQDGGWTYIRFKLPSPPSGGNIEFHAYANSAPGKPAGETHLGSMSLCGECGPIEGEFQIEGTWDNISLTATDDSSGNGTSEFSPMKAANTAPAVDYRDQIDFGDVPMGRRSPPRSITLRSIGDEPWVIDGMDTSGFLCYGGLLAANRIAASPLRTICDGGVFICSTTCESGPTEYSKGQSCSVTATFAPPLTFPSYYTTTIYVCDNTASSPNTILLTGNSIEPPPISIRPSNYDFGDVLVGSRSESASFTVSNDYGGSYSIQVGTNGDFDIVASTCGSVLPDKSTCQVAVEFVPTQSGEVAGELLVRIVSEPAKAALVTSYTARAGLKGTGVSGATLNLPESIDVGVAIVGGVNATQTVELRNDSAEAVNFSSVTVSPNFILVNNCPAVLLPGQACALVISFAAPSVGPFAGTLTVVTDATGGSAAIPLTALGQIFTGPVIRVVPTAIGFGDRVIGSMSANQSVTITNVGGAPATLGLTSSSIDFLISGNTCGATLAPQTSCFAQVAFRPLLGFGPRTGSFIVTSNSPGSPNTVSLGGTGCRPYLASGDRSGSSSNCAP